MLARHPSFRDVIVCNKMPTIGTNIAWHLNYEFPEFVSMLLSCCSLSSCVVVGMFAEVLCLLMAIED